MKLPLPSAEQVDVGFFAASCTGSLEGVMCASHLQQGPALGTLQGLNPHDDASGCSRDLGNQHLQEPSEVNERCLGQEDGTHPQKKARKRSEVKS